MIIRVCKEGVIPSQKALLMGGVRGCFDDDCDQGVGKNQTQNNIQQRQEPPQNSYGPQAVHSNSPYPLVKYKYHSKQQLQQQETVATSTGTFVNNFSSLQQIPRIQNTNHSVGGYKNEEAIQELEQNLRMVLSQRQPSHLEQQQEQHTSLSRFETSQPRQPQEQNELNLSDIRNAGIESSFSSSKQEVQPGIMTAERFSIFPQCNNFYGCQPPPGSSCSKKEETETETETETTTNATNCDDGINDRSKRENKKFLPDFSIELPNLSTTLGSSNTTSRLFTLGTELQPLAASKSCTNPMKYQKDGCFDPPKKSAASSISSNDLVAFSVHNDTMMNNLFHSELKMSIFVNDDIDKNNNDINKVSERRDSSTLCNNDKSTKAKSDIQITTVFNNQTMDGQPTKRRVSNDFNEQDNCEVSPSIIVSAADDKGGTTNNVSMKPKKKRRQGKQLKRKGKKIKESNVAQPEEASSIEEQISALPVTVLSPSLLASIVMNEQEQLSLSQAAATPPQKSRDLPIGSDSKKKGNNINMGSSNSNNKPFPLTPQECFDGILKNRGYNNLYSIDTEDAEYDAVPTPLQLASYGTYFVWAVQTSNVEVLGRLLKSGISPNACNQFRDSILCDLVCKKDNVPVYRCLVNDFHADLQVVDGCGRTLLHHCCWSRNLCKEIVTDILNKDPIQLFIKDRDGNMPLEYVRTDGYEAWNEFLNEIADTYWPMGGQLPTLFSPKDRRIGGDNIVNSPNTLVPVLAAGVSSGTITPEVAIASMNDAAIGGSGNEKK